MFSNPVRLVLILGCVGWGLYQVLRGDLTGLVVVAAGCMFAYGYFRYGTVWLAFRAARAGDLERTARLLSQTRHPERLSSQQRAYFELASGIVEANHGHDEVAAQHLRAALDHELRTENDRCIAEVALAELLAKRESLGEARALIASARKRKHNPEFDEYIAQVAASLGPAA